MIFDASKRIIDGESSIVGKSAAIMKK